jgi:hypothetical protein
MRFLFTVRMGILNVSKTIDLVSIPNLRPFFFFCPNDDSEERGKGLVETNLSGGCERCSPCRGGAVH